MAPLVTCFGLGLDIALLLAAPDTAAPPKLKERSVEFTYVAEVPALPKGAEKVEVWIPYPSSDENQRVSDIRVSSPFPTRVGRDPEYGNAILHTSGRAPAESPVRIEVSFSVTRLEHQNDPDAPGRRTPVREKPASLDRWLLPDRLVPLNQRVRSLAREVTRGAKTDLAKAHAIYDYVVSTMAYDKSGTGWGQGDIAYACDAKRGNCSDFHALFIGLARASGIPAKFEIGFPLPEDKIAGEISGYHCWAQFYLEGYGWVPVDASEAKKHPDRREYFFGAHCQNRVQLTTGRDLVLAPPQEGKPLNFFIYPYVEVDGKPYAEVQKKFSFRDRAAAGDPERFGGRVSVARGMTLLP